jgi:N-dimethylarginine dimethylaminohydrolase
VPESPPPAAPGVLSEVGALRRVLLKHPSHAFVSRERIEREWADLNFTSPPDLSRACAQYDQFAELLASTGAHLEWLPPREDAGLDSIYTRDASVVTSAGLVLARMGKRQRESEPDAQADAASVIGVPIAGRIEPPGRLEGGDVVWLDDRHLAVGRGYRTNDGGIAQLRAFAGPDVDVAVVPLPHWRGAGDVFHLMSIISPVDRHRAVVYAPLLPVPFREQLHDLGYDLIEVPHEEFESMGANVLALAPRICVMVAGNPRTQAAIERAGIEVRVYDGDDISLKGGGGPTCLTRPLVRV